MQQVKLDCKQQLTAQEVAGGILAATLANVAVFAPLVLVEGEVAQLFADMAIQLQLLRCCRCLPH